MAVTFLFSLVCAITSPIIYGIMNVFDKYILSRKIKNAFSFSIISASMVFIFGIVLSFFLDWTGVSAKHLIYPALVGIILGSQYFLYYFIMQKEDASHFVGLFYTYPVFVAILSFLFLHEVISLFGYIGMFLVLVGIVLLSIRISEIKLRASLWMIVSMILAIALGEFFIKVSTTNLSPLNGIAINYIFVGLTVYFGLFSKKTREGIRTEIKNIKWALATEILTILGGSTLFFAMVNIPATIVTTIGAIQPLVVLFCERLVDVFIGKISRDHLLARKLIPISLIALGVALIYSQEILKML